MKGLLLGGLLAWVMYGVLCAFMQDRTLIAFYGEGAYVENPGGTQVMGTQLVLDELDVFRATHTAGMGYQCTGVTTLDGSRPTMSFPDDGPPFCCWLGEEQRAIPLKVEGDRLHLMCGEWPRNQEVVVSPVPGHVREWIDG